MGNSMLPDSLKNLLELKETLNEKQKMVFLSGNFNILHAGHLRLLRFARECGDLLVVGVNSDDFAPVMMPAAFRLESVREVPWVDEAFILDRSPEEYIGLLKPDIVVKGKEWEDAENPEREVLRSYGGKLFFCSGNVIYSPFESMITDYRQSHSHGIRLSREYPARHDFSGNDLITALDKIKNLRIAVLGDLIVDEYIDCDPQGMSQEDPCIVVSPIATRKFIGGAGIVAAHAVGLGVARASFFSTVGKDRAGCFARDKLAEYGVDARLYVDESRSTIKKQRFRAGGKTLLRVNHFKGHGLNQELQFKILDDFKALVDDIDVLVFSDFNYGFLPRQLVEKIIGICEQRNIMMVADSQSSSQVGDVSRFEQMTLLTPTEREARMAMKDYESGLVVLADSLVKKARAKNVFLTLGQDGILIHAEITDTNNWLTDKLPAFNVSPRDVAGAGDCLFICASLSMAAGNDIWRSAYLGSLAAACQVSQLGNQPIHQDALVREIRLKLKLKN